MTPPLLGFALFVCVGIVATSEPAGAQKRPAPVAELSVGWAGFPDDGDMVSEGVIGATVRWYVRPRLSVGPEVAYVSGRNHRHVMLTGNITWDVLAASNDRPRPVTPFVTVGAGLFQTRGTFFGDAVVSREGAFTAGGGVRAAIGQRATAGAEARVGWETHLRLTGFIGVRLGQ